MRREKLTSICDVADKFHIRDKTLCLNEICTLKYACRFILRSLKMMKIVKVVKCQNVDFFTLKSQTLTDNIFKCDLNLDN